LQDTGNEGRFLSRSQQRQTRGTTIEDPPQWDEKAAQWEEAKWRVFELNPRSSLPSLSYPCHP
jgi:hypothetical protein